MAILDYLFIQIGVLTSTLLAAYNRCHISEDERWQMETFGIKQPHEKILVSLKSNNLSLDRMLFGIRWVQIISNLSSIFAQYVWGSICKI